MAKKVINEVNLQDMIAGLESSPAYSEYNEQILSGVLSANNKQTKPHHPVSSVERKQESGEHTEESSGTPKLSDKKYRRTSFEEYRQTFLQVPRIIDRKSVFVSASPRERLYRIVRQLGDRKMSVSGLIENLALNHLNTYQEDIEQWRKL